MAQPHFYCFPNAVGAEKDNLFHTYNNVRLFRNRISHNEPLCRAATVAATQQINDSIEFLSEKYQELLHALVLDQQETPATN